MQKTIYKPNMPHGRESYRSIDTNSHKFPKTFGCGGKK